MEDLSTRTAEVARGIEQSDSARDAGLTANDVQDVDVTVDLQGRVEEVTVQFNANHTTVRVDLFAGALTGSAGMDSHRVPLFEGDDRNTEAVLRHARRYWASQIDGVEVDAGSV